MRAWAPVLMGLSGCSFTQVVCIECEDVEMTVTQQGMGSGPEIRAIRAFCDGFDDINLELVTAKRGITWVGADIYVPGQQAPLDQLWLEKDWFDNHIWTLPMGFWDSPVSCDGRNYDVVFDIESWGGWTVTASVPMGYADW
ncbi:MAG: hypothetical protein AAFV53_18915 [Myxococcota bacterium]